MRERQCRVSEAGDGKHAAAVNFVSQINEVNKVDVTMRVVLSSGTTRHQSPSVDIKAGEVALFTYCLTGHSGRAASGGSRPREARDCRRRGSQPSRATGGQTRHGMDWTLDRVPRLGVQSLVPTARAVNAVL